MTLFYFDLQGMLIFIGCFTAIGVASVLIAELIKSRFVDLIAEGYAMTAGRMVQTFRKGIPANAEAFTIGEHQFIVDPAFATTAESWNRFGGNHPVIRYFIDDARPMSNSLSSQKMIVQSTKKGIKPTIKSDAIKPAELHLERHPKPSSGTVNLIIRRKGAAIMIAATRKVAMNPWIAAFAGAAIAGAMVYFLANFYHPGLVPAPPYGYYYKPEPIPTNATVVHS